MNRGDRDRLRKMATPTRIGEYVGKEFLGKPYKAYPWLRDVEARVCAKILSPSQEFIGNNVPPQEGKTTFFGLLLPVWYLGLHPFNNVIFITYASDYAESWGGKARDLMQRYGMELFGETVSGTLNSRGDWRMSNSIGGMLSVGIGGQITGRSGDLIIIDDVIKNIEEAGSATAKQKHYDEYEGSITTRFQEGTTVCLVSTRWADDDLTGRLKERQETPGYDGDAFEFINIKALAEPDEDEELSEDELVEWRDFLGRKADEGLKGQHSQRFFEQRRKSLTPYIFNALYQGSPLVREGGMFPIDKWQYWYGNDPTRPAIVRKVRAWDLATTAGGGDFTVGALVGLYETGDLVILGRQRVQLSSSGVEDLVKETARADGFQTKIIIEQEKAGAGHAVVEHYKRQLPGYMVEAGKVEGTKEQRATPYSIMQTSGRCWLPGDDQQLCREWREEHRRMMGDGRRPKHDDQIDTGAYAALDLLSDSGFSLLVPGSDLLFDDNGELIPMPDDAAMISVLSGTHPIFN